jgi:hypothetical protein
MTGSRGGGKLIVFRLTLSYEYYKDMCVMKCPKDQKRNHEGHCMCINEQ